MAKEIPLAQIGNYYSESIRLLVAATTLEAERRLKERTPVDTGRLRNSWMANPEAGELTNNVEYAEPVVYGTNLPPSWGGEYRTKKQKKDEDTSAQGTIPGYPDLIAKELEPWAKKEYNKIANRR